MAEEALQTVVDQDDIPWPDVSQLITEDDAPVDNLFSERQMRLLPDSLYASWAGPGEGRSFVAMADVALYFAPSQPPFVPDVLVSLDVQLPADPHKKEHRSYFMWLYGKPPDVVVEIVSNREGGELGHKLSGYARLGITYYIIHDPAHQLGTQTLYVYELRGGRYAELQQPWLETLGIGVTLWQGEYEGMSAEWLRWCDIDGELYATGHEAAQQAQAHAAEERQRAQAGWQRAEEERERADEERQRAEQESQRAEQEHARAEQERTRADRLAAQLRALGIDPAAQ